MRIAICWKGNKETSKQVKKADKKTGKLGYWETGKLGN